MWKPFDPVRITMNDFHHCMCRCHAITNGYHNFGPVPFCRHCNDKIAVYENLTTGTRMKGQHSA